MIALLIRHGHSDSVDRWLAGRRPGLSLNATGRDDVTQLVRALTWAPLAAVYTSPLERALETAAPIAGDHGLDVCVRPDLTDIDFGAWTGCTLDELSNQAEWQAFNRDREHACAPGGESLVAVQRRIVRELVALAGSHPGETVAIVTHAEPIRCALASFGSYSLDRAGEVAIQPGHISSVGVTDQLRRVLAVNVPPGEITL